MCRCSNTDVVAFVVNSNGLGMRDWLAGLGLDPGLAVGAAVAVVALVVLLILVMRRRAPRSMAEELARKGCEYLRDVMVPDGIGGEIHLDFLVLTPSGLLVADVKDYRGVLFGGERTDQWTQLVDRHSYRFDNPLFQNQLRVATLKTLLGEVPVRGCVAFTASGRFPRGMPTGVYMLDRLLGELDCTAGEGALSVKLRLAWEQLKQQARKLS